VWAATRHARSPAPPPRSGAAIVRAMPCCNAASTTARSLVTPWIKKRLQHPQPLVVLAPAPARSREQRVAATRVELEAVTKASARPARHRSSEPATAEDQLSPKLVLNGILRAAQLHRPCSLAAGAASKRCRAVTSALARATKDRAPKRQRARVMCLCDVHAEARRRRGHARRCKRSTLDPRTLSRRS
jgi:hypothetical protein